MMSHALTTHAYLKYERIHLLEIILSVRVNSEHLWKEGKVRKHGVVQDRKPFSMYAHGTVQLNYFWGSELHVAIQVPPQGKDLMPSPILLDFYNDVV